VARIHDVAATLGAGDVGILNIPVTLSDPVGDGSNYGIHIGPEVADPDSPNYDPDNGGPWYKMFDFASHLPYDWERKRLYFSGGMHAVGVVDPTHLACSHFAYSITDDFYTKIPFSASQQAALQGSNTHTYNLQAFVAGSRHFLHEAGNSPVVRSFSTDFDDPGDIGATAANYSGTELSGGSTWRGALVYFPERKSVIRFNGDTVFEKTINATSWSTLFSDATWNAPDNEGCLLRYNPVHKCVLVGGGSAARYFRVLWADGTNTAVTSPPSDMGCYFANYALCDADAVSGNFVVVSTQVSGASLVDDYRVYDYDPSDDGRGWVRHDGTGGTVDVEANLPVPIGNVSGSGISHALFDVVMGSAWDLGVLVLMGPFGTYVYKHAANTWADNGGPPRSIFKTLLPGVTETIELTDQSELTYNLSGNAALEAAVEAVAGPVTDVGSSGNCRPVHYPWADTFSTMAIVDGMLQVSMPPFAGESHGLFTKTLDVPGQGSLTASDSNVFWFQFKWKASAAYFSNLWRHVYNNYQGLGTVSCTAGSTTVTFSTYTGVTSAIIGAEITIGEGGGFVPDIYTITGTPTSSSITVNTSPAPSTNGVGAAWDISGSIGKQGNVDPTPVSIDGIKMVLWHALGPILLNARTNSAFVLDNAIDGYYVSSAGGSLPHLNDGDFYQDPVNIVTVRMEQRSNRGLNSRCEIWIANAETGEIVKVVNDETADMANEGFTAIEIQPHATRLDSTQNRPTAYVYYSEFTFSSDPIPLLGAAPSLVAGPSLASVSPDNGNPGTSVPVTLTGSNFDVGYLGGDANVVIDAPLTVDSVVVVNSTTITCDIDIALFVPSADYDVRVRTDGGLSSRRPFTVNDITGTVLGYSGPGLSSSFYSPDTLVATGPFTAASSGTAIAMHAYLPGGVDVTLGYYDNDGNLIACTSGGSFSGSPGLKERAISGPIVSGTTYWLVMWSNSSINPVHFDAASGRGKFAASTYSSGNMPAAFPSSTVLNLDTLIFLEYVAGGSLVDAHNKTKRPRGRGRPNMRGSYLR
jgi:hypothetical protein